MWPVLCSPSGSLAACPATYPSCPAALSSSSSSLRLFVYVAQSKQLILICRRSRRRQEDDDDNDDDDKDDNVATRHWAKGGRERGEEKGRRASGSWQHEQRIGSVE